MIVLGQREMFAVYETSECKFCHQQIERRRLIGWVHLSGGFYICPVKQPKDSPAFIATPIW
jgi:hypothetical protein